MCQYLCILSQAQTACYPIPSFAMHTVCSCKASTCQQVAFAD